jgi:hypothetical protein
VKTLSSFALAWLPPVTVLARTPPACEADRPNDLDPVVLGRQSDTGAKVTGSLFITRVTGSLFIISTNRVTGSL